MDLSMSGKSKEIKYYSKKSLWVRHCKVLGRNLFQQSNRTGFYPYEIHARMRIITAYYSWICNTDCPLVFMQDNAGPLRSFLKKTDRSHFFSPVNHNQLISVIKVEWETFSMPKRMSAVMRNRRGSTRHTRFA